MKQFNLTSFIFKNVPIYLFVVDQQIDGAVRNVNKYFIIVLHQANCTTRRHSWQHMTNRQPPDVPPELAELDCLPKRLSTSGNW